MASTSSPAYAYVFSSQLPNPPLLQLDVENNLSKLHTKHWGRDIGAEESKWLGKCELPDIDESEVVQGCFSLDLDVKGFGVSKLWVRKDYIRIYDHCSSYCENTLNDPNQHLAPSAIITGQPGLGKTFWILYAIRRRLGEAKPFLYYNEMRWYLFVKGGVFHIPGYLSPNSFAPYIWAFIDSNDSLPHLLTELSGLQSNLFIIFATSPQQHRWKALTPNTSPRVLIMNPWTWEEMDKAADIHNLTPSQRTHAQQLFLEYGPIPRLCINYVKDPSRLYTYQRRLNSALSGLKIDTLLSYVQLGETLNMELSHTTIILVKREDVDDLVKFTIEPISHSVQRRLRQQLMEVEQKERLRTCLLRARAQDSRMMLGIVFESLVQFQLQKDAVLNLVPMVLDESQRGNAKWRSGPSSDTGSPIRFKPKDTIEYDGSRPDGIEEGVFYVPSSDNQVAFDSFMLVDRVLYLFQMTIAASHPISEGIMEFLSHSKLRAAEWHFIFIIRGSPFSCTRANFPKMETFWKKVRLFTGEVDVHRLRQPQDDDAISDDSNQSHPSSSKRASSRLAQKRKARAPPPSPINEATSSKVRLPSNRKVRKAGV